MLSWMMSFMRTTKWATDQSAIRTWPCMNIVIVMHNFGNSPMLVTFLWRVWLTYKSVVFTKENGLLIKILRQSKGYSARKLLEEFPDKEWSCAALGRLLRQIDATGSADRKSGSSRECTVCTRDMQVSVQMSTTFNTNCNWWYCVQTANTTFPYWKLLFLSSIF